MTPLTQRIVAALLVLLALAYLGRQVWRTYATARTPKGPGCGNGCDCGH